MDINYCYKLLSAKICQMTNEEACTGRAARSSPYFLAKARKVAWKHAAPILKRINILPQLTWPDMTLSLNVEGALLTIWLNPRLYE